MRAVHARMLRESFDEVGTEHIRIQIDALRDAMQGSFLGLGTGLGSAVVDDGRIEPLELAHLPYREGKSYEDYLGARGLERLGRDKWERHVHAVTGLLRAALLCDYVVLGGGSVPLPVDA